MVVDALRKNRNLTGLGAWLANRRGSASQETGDFLECCLSKIEDGKAREVCKTLEHDTAENVDAVLHELVAHELFTRLEFTPTFKPKLPNKGLTPDMDVTINGQKYIVDVFLTHNAVKTEKGEVGGYSSTVDAGENTKKIYDVIKSKYKYDAIGKPIILVVFLGDHNVELLDVSRALYGAGLEDEWLKDKFPFGIADFQREIGSKSNQELPGGAILPNEEGVPRCANLSAVLACDWFDSLDKGRPGKQLYCAVLHHWKPNVPITEGQFRKFQEVVWVESPPNSCQYKVVDHSGAACRFSGCDQLQFESEYR